MSPRTTLILAFGFFAGFLAAIFLTVPLPGDFFRLRIGELVGPFTTLLVAAAIYYFMNKREARSLRRCEMLAGIISGILDRIQKVNDLLRERGQAADVEGTDDRILLILQEAGRELKFLRRHVPTAADASVYFLHYKMTVTAAPAFRTNRVYSRRDIDEAVTSGSRLRGSLQDLILELYDS